MKHTGYEKYIKGVQSNKIVTSQYIKQAVDRFVEFRERDDIYFDDAIVDTCIDFIAQMKHYKGKTAGKPFILEPWQEFIIANIFGLKYKETNYRVCREVYLQIARKAGKDAFMAAISLCMLVIDGEASPEIACLANSREQAKILFEYISKFRGSIDPKGKTLKQFRNYISFPANDGTVKVFSADASKLDGLNISCGVLDEFHEAKDRKLYDVMKSSQGMRNQPLMVIITTAGFNLESPCHDMFELAIEVLAKVKTDDSFFPFLYVLDPEDDWTDENNFIKVQPNLGLTVTKEFMLGEVQKAQNDATAEVSIKTKTFNMWCQSRMTWLPQDIVVKRMKTVNIEDYKGNVGVLGLDLGSVSDFTSMSLMIPIDNTYVWKTWTFIPEETYLNHPNAELYKKFVTEGSMEVTPGNVTDYDYILKKIADVNSIVQISAIYMDSWNATQTQIKMTELGYNVQPFSQSIGNYNSCTKEFEVIMKSDRAVIDKSSCVLWQFGNCELKMDHNGNVKPDKGGGYNKKIDSIISMTTALGGHIKNPVDNSWEIFVIK